MICMYGECKSTSEKFAANCGTEMECLKDVRTFLFDSYSMSAPTGFDVTLGMQEVPATRQAIGQEPTATMQAIVTETTATVQAIGAPEPTANMQAIVPETTATTQAITTPKPIAERVAITPETTATKE